MNTVTVNGKIYEITEDATNDVKTVYSQNDTLQAFPILAVTGTGRSIENGKLYEIVWDLDEQGEDASDWDLANDAIEMEDC